MGFVVDAANQSFRVPDDKVKAFATLELVRKPVLAMPLRTTDSNSSEWKLAA